jgi:hypothetical protein
MGTSISFMLSFAFTASCNIFTCDIFVLSSGFQTVQHQDMDTQQGYREVAAGAMGGTWTETSTRDQQPFSDSEVSGGRAMHHGASLNDIITCPHRITRIPRVELDVENTPRDIA